jgi:ABC-type nitrate/sulfonate/bicarbonate transport system substrate-binding protein
VASGNLPFGCNHASTLAISVSRGFPIKAIAAGWGTSKKKPMVSILVRGDSGFEKMEDLIDHSVAIPNKMEMPWLVIRQRYGLNDKVDEVVISPENVENALINKQVDAIFSINPFTEQIVVRNDVKVLGTLVDAVGEERGWPQQYVNTDFAKNNPEIVAAYVAAIADACDWAREHEKEAGILIAKALGVEESQGELYNPVFPVHALIDHDNAVLWTEKAQEYGLLQRPISLDELYTNEYNPYYKK